MWPTKLDSPIADVPPVPVEVAEDAAFASRAGLAVSPMTISVFGVTEVLAPVRPLRQTILGGAAAGCGYVLGRTTSGTAVLVASVAVGLALLGTVV